MIITNSLKITVVMANFQEILKAKREYYGDTEAAIEFAAEEFSRQEQNGKKNATILKAIELNKKYEDRLRLYQTEYKLQSENWNTWQVMSAQKQISKCNEFIQDLKKLL